MTRSAVLAIVLCSVLSTGCVSSRRGCYVTVSNVSDTAVSAVTLSDGRPGEFSFGTIEPKGTAPYLRAKPPLARSIQLSMASADGEPRNTDIDLGKTLEENFIGRVIIEIRKDGTVRPFVLPWKKGDNESDLPWAIPPSWQGTVSLPGMSGSGE